MAIDDVPVSAGADVHVIGSGVGGSRSSGGASLATIVTVAMEGVPRVTPCGFDSVTVKVSSSSSSSSSVIGTAIVPLVCPAVMVSVPLAVV